MHGGPAGAGEGDGVATVRERPDRSGCASATSAKLLGVSPNTVRRWTDVGPHRRPSQPRRPPPLPRRRRPRAPAAGRERGRRAARRLRAPAPPRPRTCASRCRPDWTSCRCSPRTRTPSRLRRLASCCGLTGAPRCDIYFTRRRPAAARRLPGRRRARARPPRLDVGHADVDAGRRRPGGRAGSPASAPATRA